MKKYSKAYKEEKNKLKFFEDGLIKSLNILLEIGQEKFKVFSPEQEKIILSLCDNFKEAPVNYKLFHRWCISIVNTIVQLNR